MRFQVTGRLSAKHDSDAVAANFRWTHDGERDDLVLTTVGGQTVAALSGDAQSVTLDRGAGRIEQSRDWETLTARGLGWPLPVRGLASWIQGAPHEGSAFAFEPGSSDATVLRQDGWTIVYLSSVSTPEGTRRPSRVTLSYPEVELRLVIDQWS